MLHLRQKKYEGWFFLMSNKNQIKKSRPAGELENRFENQMDYLFRSSKAFDSGQENESARIANTLRVLLHQTKHSHALLKQLNLVDKLNFVDSGVHRDLLNQVLNDNPEGLRVVSQSPADTGLVTAVIVGHKATYRAPLVRNRFHPNDQRFKCIQSPKPFDDWWNTPFIETSSEKIFSRSQIVLIMANQDGGSHVDPEIDADFMDFCQDFYGIEVAVNSDNHEDLKPADTNIVNATIRQIAFELMATIDDHFGTSWVLKTNQENKRVAAFPVMMPVAIYSK